MQPNFGAKLINLGARYDGLKFIFKIKSNPRCIIFMFGRREGTTHFNANCLKPFPIFYYINVVF